MSISKVYTNSQIKSENESKPKPVYNNTILSELNASHHTTAQTPNAFKFQSFNVKYGHTNQSMTSFFNKSINSTEKSKTLDTSKKYPYGNQSTANANMDQSRISAKSKAEVDESHSNTSHIDGLHKADKYLKKILYNRSLNIKNNGKISKRSNAEKSKKTSNLSIIKVGFVFYCGVT
jgi:hypothetical protein